MANSPFPIMQLANAAGQVIDPASVAGQAAATPAPVTFPSGSKTVSGTIAAAGGTVEIDCTGYASAVISIVGTFVGTLRARGSASATAALGGRLLFKSGVGALGVPAITNTGAAISNEYRVVAGGTRLLVDASAWTSGSAVVTITATQSPSILFVNGPVHDAIEEAVRAGRAYNASTGMQSVNAANFLNFRFVNPADSGKNVFLYRRRFDNNIAAGATPGEYYGISTPVVLTNPIALTPTNMRGGGAPSAMQVTYAMNSTRLDSSPTTTSPIGGVMQPSTGTFIDQLRMLVPGQSFGHYIGGAGGGLAATGRFGQAWFWFEEDVS